MLSHGESSMLRRMTKRPTIMDVARLCNVTPATVSRVLNGKPNFSAREEVRARILKTAEEIGYVPDLAARNLNRRKTRIVGIFASPYTNLAEGISESLLEGLVGVLHPAKYETFFKLSSSGETDAAGHPLPFWRFDGAVLLQAPAPETVEALRRRRVPFVGVNEIEEHAAAVVISSDTQGVELALDHLKELGHKVIAYTNASDNYIPHYSIAERHDALVQGARRRKMQLLPGHEQRFDRDAPAFVQHAMKHGATAIIAYDHQQAVVLQGTMHQLNVRMPDEMSLMCFNDLFPVAMLAPPLTAIRVNGRAMGETGGRLLLEALAANKERPQELVRVEEELVVRASTAPPRRGDA